MKQYNNQTCGSDGDCFAFINRNIEISWSQQNETKRNEKNLNGMLQKHFKPRLCTESDVGKNFTR